MFYNNLFYDVYNDQQFFEMKKGIEIRKSELSKLQSKIFKTQNIINQINEILEDIKGAEIACEKYEEQQNKLKREKLATLLTIDCKIKGTSFKKNELNQVLSYIDKHSDQEKFGGYSNKEIEEIGARQYKYDGFYTENFTLEKDMENIEYPDAVKVLVNTIFVGYLPKESSSKVSVLLDSGKSIVKGRITVVGGPYKEFDYLEDKVVTVKNEFGLKLSCKFLNKYMYMSEV